MARAQDGSVNVRVEVTVTGAGVTVTRAARPIPYAITMPAPATTQTSVRVDSDGSTWFCARGTTPGPGCLVVWAKAYPTVLSDAVLTSKLYARPGLGAVSVAPNIDNTWAYDDAHGNELSGATCDPDNPTGDANNTLVIWYDYGPDEPYAQDHVYFHGYCDTQTDCQKEEAFRKARTAK
jgi:hypothetical protein